MARRGGIRDPVRHKHEKLASRAAHVLVALLGAVGQIETQIAIT